MITTVRWVTLLLLTVCGVLSVSAHEQNAAVTRVSLNERTGNIEVMHRFSVHDLEHAGRKLFNRSVNLLENEADRQRFADYVHSRFSLADQNGAELRLEPVGHELDGRYLWVYSEIKIPKELSKLAVFHEALLEVWPTQSNLVNVEVGDSIKSATFVRGSSVATIAL